MLFLLSVRETVFSKHWISALDSFINLCKSAPERFKISFIDFMSAEIRKIFINSWITVLCIKENVFPLSATHVLKVYIHCVLVSWAGNIYFKCINTCYKIVWKFITGE